LEDKFYSNRAYVLIDAQGVVRWTYAEPTEDTRRESQDLLATIRNLG
jgi:hypothetical protein